MNGEGERLSQLLDHPRIGGHGHISHFGESPVRKKSDHRRKDEEESELEKNLSGISKKDLQASAQPSRGLREQARELQSFLLILRERNRLDLTQNILRGKSFWLGNGTPIGGPLLGFLLSQSRVDELGTPNLKVLRQVSGIG